jgi:dihydrofolate reductase
MARLIYALNQSLDGYVDHLKMGPPPASLFQHFLDWTLSQAGFLYGRRVYEIMRYWENDQADWEQDERDYAAAWRSKPKWVVSKTLKSVGPNATLLPSETQDDVESAIRKLKADHEGEIGVAGPNLAASLTNLIDEYRIYFRPIVLGSGQPFFVGPRPPLHLVTSELMADGIVRLTYVPAKARTAS